MTTLLDRILCGEPEAVSEFYRSFAPKIEKYLLKKLPPEDALEITNDVFLDAIDALPTLQNTNNVEGWLYRIARNKIADYYRKRKIKSFVLSTMPFLQILASEIDEPEFQMEKNKVRDQIETAFHIISGKYRHILLLHYEEERPVKEIALLLNLSPKATESLLFRARQSFKEAYGRA